MAEELSLALAFASSVSGMAWLALAKPSHWEQARGKAPLAPPTARKLRRLGSAVLGLSLLLCLAADHATMAALVWVMFLAASALVVAFTLAWRPRWLAWLAAAARPKAGT